MKRPIRTIALIRRNWGIVGDAHSGSNRQVSFLGWEVVEKFKIQNSKLKIKIKPGDFAENITTKGIDWTEAKVGNKIIIKKNVSKCLHLPELQITQIGKECHSGCAIKKLVGNCIMPKSGVFAKVLSGGKIKTGDKIEVKND
ncbi:MAG: MOSC domain-containing protein [Elusimicrobiota bacterium]